MLEQELLHRVVIMLDRFRLSPAVAFAFVAGVEPLVGLYAAFLWG